LLCNELDAQTIAERLTFLNADDALKSFSHENEIADFNVTCANYMSSLKSLINAAAVGHW